jgi:SAM-dependent methyltransferase/TusA-related sulfurtransferase
MSDLMRKAQVQAFVGDAYRTIDAPTRAGAAGYTDAQLADLPAGAVAWSLGLGNPLAHADLRPGDVVLDVGCGAGIDTLLAARRVGDDGVVVGLDLVGEMCERARAYAREAGIGNVVFVQGEMEAIPLPDGSIDAIISNGVINLSPRKMRALFECARVLRPAGRICVTDMIIDEQELPVEVLTHPAAWSGCVSGAMAERTLLRSLGRVGLVNVTVHERRAVGIADCARYPLFSSELLAVMRRTIPPDRQDRFAGSITVSARKAAASPHSTSDAGAYEDIASVGRGNKAPPGDVLQGMSEAQPTDEHLPAFDAGDRHCGDGVGRDLRDWWAMLPPGTRTSVVVRDPSTRSDVPALARMLGHTIEHSRDIDGGLRLTVRTKGS